MVPVAFAVDAQAENLTEKKMGLEEIRSFTHQNREVIMERMNREIASENLSQRKSERLPDLLSSGDGYLSQKLPLTDDGKSSHSFRYHFNLYTEFDLYAGGTHSNAIERLKKEHQLSEERLKALEQEVNLKGYVLLYDIYRNMKYQDFILKSIQLREKEYERINQLYLNGLVLKSDLLRSKLYITDLQKDEVAIKNSIDILSDQLCALLGMESSQLVNPQLEGDLEYHIGESFDELFEYALMNSPELKIHRTSYEREEIVLKEIKSLQRPHLSLYAQYGVGSPQPYFNYKHQLGGEVGLKLSFKLSSLYKNKHKKSAQQVRIQRQATQLTDEEVKLKNTLFELYTRYNESLLNINRALEKIDMSKESMRILRNSYFNQQALLIDVLESETQSMQASFEWVEAVVDSQKYYWALKQICGYL